MGRMCECFRVWYPNGLISSQFWYPNGSKFMAWSAHPYLLPEEDPPPPPGPLSIASGPRMAKMPRKLILNIRTLAVSDKRPSAEACSDNFPSKLRVLGKCLIPTWWSLQGVVSLTFRKLSKCCVFSRDYFGELAKRWWNNPLSTLACIKFHELCKWFNLRYVLCWSGAGVGVTKPNSSISLFSELCRIVKTHVSYCMSRLYLAGVTSAELRRHLSNINVIRRI